MTDPRPYHYQFRRPRVHNPTYQSHNAYESLYHMGKKQYINQNSYNHAQADHMQSYAGNNQYNSNSPYSNGNNFDAYVLVDVRQSGRSSEMSNISNKQPRYESIGINTENKSNRSSSNYSQRGQSGSSSTHQEYQKMPENNRASILSTYGSNSLQKKEKNNYENVKTEARNVVFSKDLTSEVFKRQQKPFNIINLYSKNNEPLRKYQKFTLEHLMYEKRIDTPGG